MLFIYMVVVYVLVYKKATNKNFSTSTRKDPNQEMQKKISRLLLTDCFCWIPVCIMSYLSVAGVSLPPDAYIVSAGFLLPINSAMNPLLYSTVIGHCMSRAQKCISRDPACTLPKPCNDTTKIDTTGDLIKLGEIHVNF